MILINTGWVLIKLSYLYGADCNVRRYSETEVEDEIQTVLGHIIILCVKW